MMNHYIYKASSLVPCVDRSLQVAGSTNPPQTPAGTPSSDAYEGAGSYNRVPTSKGLSLVSPSNVQAEGMLSPPSTRQMFSHMMNCLDGTTSSNYAQIKEKFPWISQWEVDERGESLDEQEYVVCYMDALSGGYRTICVTSDNYPLGQVIGADTFPVGLHVTVVNDGPNFRISVYESKENKSITDLPCKWSLTLPKNCTQYPYCERYFLKEVLPETSIHQERLILQFQHGNHDASGSILKVGVYNKDGKIFEADGRYIAVSADQKYLITRTRPSGNNDVRKMHIWDLENAFSEGPSEGPMGNQPKATFDFPSHFELVPMESKSNYLWALNKKDQTLLRKSLGDPTMGWESFPIFDRYSKSISSNTKYMKSAWISPDEDLCVLCFEWHDGEVRFFLSNIVQNVAEKRMFILLENEEDVCSSMCRSLTFIDKNRIAFFISSNDLGYDLRVLKVNVKKLLEAPAQSWSTAYTAAALSEIARIDSSVAYEKLRYLEKMLWKKFQIRHALLSRIPGFTLNSLMNQSIDDYKAMEILGKKIKLNELSDSKKRESIFLNILGLSTDSVKFLSEEIVPYVPEADASYEDRTAMLEVLTALNLNRLQILLNILQERSAVHHSLDFRDLGALKTMDMCKTLGNDDIDKLVKERQPELPPELPSLPPPLQAALDRLTKRVSEYLSS